MRKALVVLVLVFVMVLGAFAQRSIDEMNGYDWVTWTTDHKAAFVQGYYAACVMMIAMAYEVNQQSMSKEQLDQFSSQLENQFYYSDSIGTLAGKIDDFYASPANRKYVVYRLLPFLEGKEWWNRKTGVVDPPAGTS